MTRVAVLDDYQDVALQMADWTVLPPDTKVQVFKDHLSSPEAVAERLKDFDIVVAMRERTAFPRSLLERLPALKLLVTTGMRNASIDVGAATDLGITVCGTQGVGYPTAELTWGLILALLRHIPREDRATREGRWQVSVGVGLRDKVLGLIGLGNLGSQVATVGKAFGMSLLAWSQNLTAERAAQFGARELALMKRTAYLINTSRGPIVDEPALIQALRQGTIAGAALDVYDEEPLPLDHPLRHLPNTVITPHLGYVTVEGYKVFYSHVVEDIQAFLQGKPVRVINAATADRR